MEQTPTLPKVRRIVSREARLAASLLSEALGIKKDDFDLEVSGEPDSVDLIIHPTDPFEDL